MWKDFFYYSKSERRAVYVLLTLIAVLVVLIVLIPEQQTSSRIVDSGSDSLELKMSASEEKTRSGKPEVDSKAELFSFEPNLADSLDFIRLGLSKFVVRNIIKYRQKGGRFVTPESFLRIYGLTEDKFAELKPYIYISEAFAKKPVMVSRVRFPEKQVKKDTLKRTFKYPVGVRIDVNLADTSELKKIPGIGGGIANRIVKYRTRLGGFYSLEQLLEVEFVTPEMLEWFALGDESVRKLEINKASLEQLRSHPYLNFYQARAIVEHRRKRGNITSLSQISLYEEFSEKDLLRLSAYVSFD